MWPEAPIRTVSSWYDDAVFGATAGEIGEVLISGDGVETKSVKEGPAFRASLNFVGCRRLVGCDAGGGSDVVANERAARV